MLDLLTHELKEFGVSVVFKEDRPQVLNTSDRLLTCDLSTQTEKSSDERVETFKGCRRVGASGGLQTKIKSSVFIKHVLKPVDQSVKRQKMVSTMCKKIKQKTG